MIPIETGFFYGSKQNPFIPIDWQKKINPGSHVNPLFLAPDKPTIKAYLRAISSDLVSSLDALFGLKKRGKLLDVGPADDSPIRAALQNAGIEVNTIDIKHYPDRYPPKISNGPGSFDGDIVLASRLDSALVNERFGSILFWGSWDTEGFSDENSMIVNTIYKRLLQRIPKVEKVHVKEWVSREKDEIINSCRLILEENGLMINVSANFSFFGGGFHIGAFDHSIISQLDFIRRNLEQGAKKFYVFGRTGEEFKQIVEDEIEQIRKTALKLSYLGYFEKSKLEELQRFAERLDNPIELPSIIEDSFLTDEDVAQAGELWKRLSFNQEMGLIDMIVIEF